MSSASPNNSDYASPFFESSNSSQRSSVSTDNPKINIPDIFEHYDPEINGIGENYPTIDSILKTTTTYKYDPTCLRKKSNWSTSGDAFKFDSVDFSPKALEDKIPTYSPKLDTLLKRIEDLDKRDMEKDGRKYKHFIFSDLKSGLYGARLIAGALIAKGMELGYSAELLKRPKKKKLYDKIKLKSEAELLKNKYNNFYLLSSVGVYQQPIGVEMKKTILKTFNSRPDNIYGELARIIIMDSGYKEGIDLFDIKYVHIYEPQTTMADQKQVIGRGTRTCGQKGLDFHPTKGWPLYVYIYDTEIPDELRRQMLGSRTLFDLYMKSMGIDFRLFNFQHDLERATVFGSVDYELNRPIHNFAIEPDEDDMMFGGGPKKIVVNKNAPKLILGENMDEPMNFEQNREFVSKYYRDYAWKNIKMENNCVETKKGGASSGGATLINYTPTQDFVRNYFTPRNPVKGMFLWHSVGTGKTCSAIAAATSSFEQEGYTILWVTRTTLKNDIWKNMFDQVCNESIRRVIETGNKIPEGSKRMKLLSKSWSIRPMSYKQFSNLVSKKNSFYEALVKKNGEADPLHRTLLIIDEAHKLYGGEDLSSIERPDMNALMAALQNSYMVSGKDSVRLLLMTATPITGNPMELIKLINLLKPLDKQMPEQFDDFSYRYLNEEGRFTPEGERDYLDDIAGYVSYLNREKDARQFSQPIVKFVNTPLIDDIDAAINLDKKLLRETMMGKINDLKDQIAATTNIINDEAKTLNKNKLKFLKRKCENLEGKSKKNCEKIIRGHITEIVRTAKLSMKETKEKIKELRAKIKGLALAKTEKLQKMKAEMNVELTGKIDEMKKTMYYQVLNKCGKKLSETGLNEVVKTEPRIQALDNDLERLDSYIKKMHDDIAIIAKAHENKINQIKELLKDKTLSADERLALRLIIKDHRKTNKKTIKELNMEASMKIKDIEKQKRLTMKKRKKGVATIKKRYKALQKQEKAEAKAMLKAMNAEEKRLQKNPDYVYEIKTDYIRDLVNEHREQIDNEVDLMVDEYEVNENEKQLKILAKEEKKLAREEKKLANETRKQQKALDAQHRQTVKNQKNLEKEAKKEAKEAEKQAKEAEKQAKEAEKHAKEAQKQAEKQAKEAEKQAEKQAKEAEKQAKAAEKEAEKHAKEAQKQAKEEEKRGKELEKQMQKQAKEAEKQAKALAKEEKAAAAATRKLQAEQKKLNKTVKAHKK